MCSCVTVFCSSSSVRGSGYIGGAGHSVWDSTNDHHINSYKNGSLIRDMFVVMIWMKNANPDSWWLSLSGKMPSSLSVEKNVDDMVYYPGCRAYSDFWGWSTDSVDYLTKDRRFVCTVPGSHSDATRKYNMITCDEGRFDYMPGVGFEHWHDEHGHWGKELYAGCGLVWGGQAAGHLITPSYIHQNAMSLTR